MEQTKFLTEDFSKFDIDFLIERTTFAYYFCHIYKDIFKLEGKGREKSQRGFDGCTGPAYPEIGQIIWPPQYPISYVSQQKHAIPVLFSLAIFVILLPLIVRIKQISLVVLAGHGECDGCTSRDKPKLGQISKPPPYPHTHVF